MGMFDYVLWNGDVYQTKDTPNQFMDHYHIIDGKLYEETYRIEDRSDPSKPGLEGLAGILTKVDVKTVESNFTGSINFYDYGDDHVWVEYLAVFHNGVLQGGVVQIE